MFERFDRDTAEIRRARQLVRASLQSWGRDAHVDAFELAASELVTNAVVHGDGEIGLRLEARDDEVCLEVTDAGPSSGVPRPIRSQSGDGGGWGLRLMAAISSRWGASTGPAQTRVWMVRRSDEPPLSE